MNTADMAEFWEQQPDESRAQYLQFLTYRNLGPCRTLDLAYRQYLSDYELSSSVPERASSTFRETSSEFQWVNRSQAWDLWRMVTYGSRVAVLYTHAVELIAEKLARAAGTYDLDSKQWKTVLATLRDVAAQLSAARKIGALGLEGPPEIPEANVGTDTHPAKLQLLAPVDPDE